MKKAQFLFAFFSITYCSFGQLSSLANVSSWAYQLQNISTTQIAADTSFELVVIDYSSDGSDAGKFSAAEISSIKSSGKYAISYISIGEAEDYRYYWQASWNTSPPAWLGPVNPDWAGNYKVRFWDPQWQALIFDYVDTIIAQGFDGIYLDIVDAWYYWTDENPEEPKADSLMIDFINKLREHVDAATGGPGFIIMPQNGEDVLDGENIDAPMRNLLYSSVNGIGVEDVFYPGNLDEDNAYLPDLYRDSLLTEFSTNGKQVFSIEYLTDTSKIQQYLGVATGKSYIPYYCTRELDQLCQNVKMNNTILESGWSYLPGIARYDVYDITGRLIDQCYEPYCNWLYFIQEGSSGLVAGIYVLRSRGVGLARNRKIVIAR